MKKIILIKENKCEGCDKPLLKNEWPWLYRSIGKLCIKCKEVAREKLGGVAQMEEHCIAEVVGSNPMAVHQLTITFKKRKEIINGKEKENTSEKRNYENTCSVLY